MFRLREQPRKNDEIYGLGLNSSYCRLVLPGRVVAVPLSLSSSRRKERNALEVNDLGPYGHSWRLLGTSHERSRRRRLQRVLRLRAESPETSSENYNPGIRRYRPLFLVVSDLGLFVRFSECVFI